MQTTKEELIKLTSPYLNRPDLIQGPGGNTSIKEGDQMFIKASGFRFDEMNLNNGISAVNYRNIREYFFSVQPLDKVIEEANMLKIVSDNILNDESGNNYPKPSMETGFHAVLEKYVVHTHSVWTNLLNCSEEKLELIDRLSKEFGFNLSAIPFVSPGFGLSYLITDALKQSDKAAVERPDIFLLTNHGVIAHGDSADSVNELLFRLDDAIRTIFKLDNSYPDTEITGSGNLWAAAGTFVADVLKKYGADEAFFNQVLFPDQTVFFKNQMSFGNAAEDRRIHIDSDYKISYDCNQRDAKNIHETMTAYLFLHDVLDQKGRKKAFIGASEIDYIDGMEMEKHRRNVGTDESMNL